MKKVIRLNGVFSRVSQTLRKLGYNVESDPDTVSIKVFAKDPNKCVFSGKRRDCWKWLYETGQIITPWEPK